MNETFLTVNGFLGGDPQLRFTPNGVPVCEVSVASTPRRKVGDEWVDKETVWYRMSCWRELGENVAQTLKKGDRVIVTGKLLKQSYERKDGTSGMDLVLDVTSIGPDLRRCPAELKRPVRAGSTAEALPEHWVNTETGEILSRSGPLVDYEDLEDLEIVDEEEADGVAA